MNKRNQCSLRFATAVFLQALAWMPTAVAGTCIADPSAHAQQVQSSGSAGAKIRGDAEIIQGIDAAVRSREVALAGYTVKDHYSIFRNGETNPSAEMTVLMVYKQGAGKQFTTVSETGSSFLRGTIIQRIIAGEKEMSNAPLRETVLVNSTNYAISPEAGTVQLNGRECILVGLKSRRKNQHLFNGRAWVDAADFSVVRLEGVPSQSLSFFAGDSTMARDYAKFEGIPMATRAVAHAHSFLLGDTVLKIESTDYHIQRNP